jgi:hypothetical protein
MCFSASASFAATGVVSVAGVAALGSAKKPSHLLLGAIPLFFAVHQFAEGVLWLALSGGEHAAWRQPAMFTFLIVGRVVWPFWIPLAILGVEEDPARRKVLWALLSLGVSLAVAETYGLLAYPVSASIAGQHVQYRLDSPLPFRWAVDTCYVLVTVLPPFASSIRLTRTLGMLVLVSFIVSKIFYYQYFISVWCFFAALISAMVVAVVRRSRTTALVDAVS